MSRDVLNSVDCFCFSFFAFSSEGVGMISPWALSRAVEARWHGGETGRSEQAPSKFDLAELAESRVRAAGVG